jgi:hypothetical protein
MRATVKWKWLWIMSNGFGFGISSAKPLNSATNVILQSFQHALTVPRKQSQSKLKCMSWCGYLTGHTIQNKCFI